MLGKSKQRYENGYFQKDNSKFQLLFHNLLHCTPHIKMDMLKNKCKAAKILKRS